MQCKNCNGVMVYNTHNFTMECPYCGASELVDESVAIEKIRSDTMKDIEHEKQKAYREVELSRITQNESENKVKSFKKSKFSKALIISTVICLLISIGGFRNVENLSAIYIFASLITLIQTILFFLSWILGMQLIKVKNSNLYMILAIIGFALIIPFIIAMP